MTTVFIRRRNCFFFRQLWRWPDIQLSVCTKNSPVSLKMRRGSCLEKLAKRSYLDTTRTSGWVSRCPRRPLRARTLTRNAPLPVIYPSVDIYCLAWWPRWRGRRPLSSTKTTSTTSESTTTLRSATRTCQCTCPLLQRCPDQGYCHSKLSPSSWARPYSWTCSRSPRLSAPRSNSRGSESRHPPTPPNKIKLFSQPKKRSYVQTCISTDERPCKKTEKDVPLLAKER